MTDVIDKLHLTLRGNTWHYFRRVPKDLVSVIGKKFFKQSLNTSSHREALKRRNVLDVEVDHMLTTVEQTFALGEEDAAPLAFSKSMLEDRLRSYVEAQDKKAALRLAKNPAKSSEELADMKVNAEMGLQILANRDDPRGDEWIGSTFDKIFDESQAAPTDKAIVTELAEMVRRSLVEMQRRSIDRLNDDFSGNHHDALFSPSHHVEITIGEIADRFWEERQNEMLENNTGQQLIDTKHAQLGFLRELIGAETPVSAINDDVVQNFRQTLSKMPTHRKQRFPNLSIADAVKKAAETNASILSPVTQVQYLDTLRDVFAFAVRKGWLAINFAQGVKPIKKDQLSDEDKAKPFTDQQIVQFFTGSFYKSCRPGASQPYSKRDLGWRFWLPLFTLFTGARPNEICHLNIENVKCSKNGTWYLDLREAKRLKTKTSRRRIPIHPEILHIGFLAFVEERRKANGKHESQLFPEIRANKYNNAASYPTRRFRERFIPAEITLDERQSFYSFRHNFRDALRRIEAPPETLLAVAAWSQAGKVVSDNYGDPGNPDLHIKWVEKVSYPGLDLSFLHGAWA